MEAALASTPSEIGEEALLTGRSIAPGLGMGHAWVVGDLLKYGGDPRTIGSQEIDGELARLTSSFEQTLAELQVYAERIEAEFDSALAGVFRAHSAMLRDLFASGEFERELKESLITAEATVRRVFQRWYQKFDEMENQTFRERADDLLDLGRNIIRLLPKANVAAVIVESLGQGSHAALLAREKGIPTIAEIPGILSRVANGTELLVDGFHGTVVITPAAATCASFQERLAKWRATLAFCKGACRDPARSLDGCAVSVEANVGVEDDVEIALDNGADGIGLLRIEQLYFARKLPPTENELFGELKRIVAPLGARPVTIRLLDIGGDKPLPYLRLSPTSNPVLGRRGVRLLLDYSQLVRTQISALLRLSEEHAIRVLIPMVTLEDDIRRMRQAFDTACTERKISNCPQFGAMIETPAAALAISTLVKHVDFFCVGTNDLTQYTMAAARDDASVNDYYQDSHESILRLLKITLSDAGDKSVTLCGELAGREAMLPKLLHMGFRSLSIAPTIIPAAKAAIRKIDVSAS
jgi:phosphoenolpyruvate-protein kinase (PTS system EI component)